MTKIETLSALSDHSSIFLEDITLVMPVSVIWQGRTGPAPAEPVKHKHNRFPQDKAVEVGNDQEIPVEKRPVSSGTAVPLPQNRSDMTGSHNTTREKW